MERNKSVLLKSDATKVLKDAIQEGIESGIAKDFNPKKQLDSLKANKNK